MDKMTDTEARAAFTGAIEAAKVEGADADRIARMEVIREFFCNPEFRSRMSDFVADVNGLTS